MAVIRPSADLRNNYNEISRICHETKKPVYITKNGFNDLVILSNEAFENMQADNEKQIEKLISEKFDQHYADFEDFKKEVFKKIENAQKEIEDGRSIPMESAVAELEAKYEKL